MTLIKDSNWLLSLRTTPVAVLRGIAQWYSAEVVIRRSQVQSPAGAEGGVCSPELFRRSFRPRITAGARKRPLSFSRKWRWRVTAKQAYTLDPTKSVWAVYAVPA